MQRYHAGSCTSAVNNSAFGGIQTRDTSRAESPAVPPNFSLNPRRSSQPAPYTLRCEKEQLNSRLGPPDFHQPTPNCPEETLTREYVQSGYRETVEGLEEGREISFSQVQAFTKPLIVKCKEAIRKCHRAINESRAQKRKAGQVYGVPLSGSLLTKSGSFPELRPCGEDFRKKWIEGLSQPHKRLRSLADHVPHGYRRKSLFEVLIRNNVPLLRATWFIKVTYLNQVRAASSNSSSSFHEKTQFQRSELWTKDVVEYLQHLLDEFMARNVSHSNLHMRERSQMVYAGSVHKKSDSFSSVIDVEEPSLHTKWWYVVRIIQWHYAEGLLVPSLIIDWVLNQLQEKELLGVLQLLLPIVYGVIETVVLSQTYVRTLVGIAIRFIREPSPGGSDLVDNSRRAYTTTAVVEMVRYLILAVPDTFVALDCLPLPACVLSHVVNCGNFLSQKCEDSRKVKDGQIEVTGARRFKIHEAQTESLSFLRVVSSIQKRAETLSRAARPNQPGYNVAKASHVLDQALTHGDIVVAYKLLFENLWDGAWAQHWIAQVSRCLYTSLKHISSVTSSLICSIFYICEWATCEFRDFRTAPTHGMKFTGKRDVSQIFIAIRLLKLKMSNMQNVYSSKKRSRDIFESPGPLHDIIVCWIDQHEVHNGEGFKRLQILIRELIQCGVFNPQAYVRQLIVSGIMDGNGSMVDLERRKRHHKLLKELPAPYIRDAMEETQISEPSVIVEAMDIYSNERRLVLHGLLGHLKSNPNANGLAKQKKRQYSFTGLKLEELKGSISALLQLPVSPDTGITEAQGSSVKRPGGPINVTDAREEASGCEECKRAKRQKLSEERTSYPAGEEEIWWVNKELKYMESFRTEPPPPPPPPKPTKQSSRGRQKNVRKTQSLAQLADARIEGSQGASTSHICESKTGCPHHRTGFDETLKSVDGSRKPPTADILLIGKTLKKMRFVDKRTVAAWLISVVKQFIEEAEKLAAKGGGQYGRPTQAVDNRSSLRWRLGEDELSAILYVMDACDELVSAIRFLLWLFPKLPSNPGSVIHSRNTLMLPRFAENNACEIGEAFLLSCIRRYENLIIAADLVPETLSATVRRAAAVLASNGRLSGLPALVYARHLLRKYGNIVSVTEWQKAFTSTSDKRLSSELESGRSSEGDFGFPYGVPNGVEDPDDYIRQKITGVRVSRVGLTMKEIVHRHIEEVFQYFYSKDRKPFGSGSNKNPSMDKLDDGYQLAKQIVIGLMDCMRQTGGAAQEGDPSLVSNAIAAIVNNFGLVVAKIPDLTTGTNHLNNFSPPSGSLNFAQHILHIHITCLCILKEALGERQSRVFEVALATEASNALMQAFTPGKGETLNHSNKSAVLGRASKISGAVSALVVGSILQGVSSLERMVTLFRLKEGLDLIQFARSMKSNVNGNSRSMGVLKVDNLIEVSVNWFRVLVGNCRTVADGLVVDLLGEASIVALFRMQRMLSLNVVFSPAFSIFAFVVWRPILDASFGAREDFHQLSHLLATGIGDAIKHLPFREICLRDTYGLYDIIAADNVDAEFVSLLEFNGSDINLKAAAVVPLRSRLFLDALLDCKIPEPTADKNWVSGQLKKRSGANVKNLMGKLVHVLDTLQPARFHWQWVELRLLLNEQAVNEKMENDISLIEAIRSLSPNPDKSNASESESNFIQIILTRLLVRPDAAPLFSEVVRLLGKSLEDSMLSQAKWLLRGAEVLYGKKSIRQKVINIAGEFKELSLKPQHWKPWGWCCHSDNNKGEKWKSEGSILEEGEVDEGTNFNPSGKGSVVLDVEGFIVSQQHVTERALIELILPCLDQGSDDLRYNFASEMIKQMSNIEQQINAVTCGVGKQAIAPSPAIGTPANKSGSRKGGKSGSPAISRQSVGAGDTVPPSPAALRASMTLRLQFLIRLLPIICADREPSGRNMRYALATVILRLLGSRVVHEGQFVNNPTFISSKRDSDSFRETYAAAELLCGESIFDCLLLVLHVLLSCYQPSWLKLKSESKGTECSKDYASFDREVAESLQNDLDRMELPETIRWRIQTAMPILFPSAKCSIFCQPPSLPPNALAFLQPSNPVTMYNSNPPQRNRSSTNLKTKPQALQQENLETDIMDQWTLLEDGAGSGLPSANSSGISSSDHSNLKASNWLKGAVRGSECVLKMNIFLASCGMGHRALEGPLTNCLMITGSGCENTEQKKKRRILVMVGGLRLSTSVLPSNGHSSGWHWTAFVMGHRDDNRRNEAKKGETQQRRRLIYLI
ncbi:mediator of RNA polymerase ii transcription subunit 12 [Phtheirospermum japonicum]|uniref:Mediator of RNA polymerase ii transcription subunit 12 n=1 Tax=Phtheirospermum japonicum TaxID=374723 RepID=A0A830CM83_9LAMI|nr:mediator of RNA polymerase ii transcription subunit 12 [Phtheirospermum japonicum]